MASREQLSADLQEAREEVEELRNQIDQLQEDSAQEIEDLEQQLKDQYAAEMTSKDDKIAALEAQLAEQNESWETSYNELQEQKTAMETDYESKLATWTKSRVQGREVWTNPVTGETASTDMTWKNPREKQMEADMKKMKEKLDRNNAESRKGSSKVQVVQTELNEIRKQLKVEQNAHEALRRSHFEDLSASWDEIDKLEKIVMELVEEMENSKVEKEEQLTRLYSVIRASQAKILRTKLEAEESTREMKKGMKSARLVQVALERRIQRLIMNNNQAGLALAESETRAANAEAIKQKEFDVLRVKLSKAYEVHQDDCEALARLWPDDNGYTLPTALQPYADVIRIERERKLEIEKIKEKNLKIDYQNLKKHNGRQKRVRGIDDIDTDSDDDDAAKHRDELERELELLREELLYPSLRQIDSSELSNPKFKVISTTPRRRKFALYDTPRAFIDKVPNIMNVTDEEQPQGSSTDGITSGNNGEMKVIGESGTMVNPPDNILNDEKDGEIFMDDAVKSALKLRLQLPKNIIKYTPATAIGSVAKQVGGSHVGRGSEKSIDQFAGDPWDSDDDSYIPSNYVTPRDPNDVHDVSDEKDIAQKEFSAVSDNKHDSKHDSKHDGDQKKKVKKGEQKEREEKGEKDSKEGEKEEVKEEEIQRNPITGQPLKVHHSGPSLGPVAPPPPVPKKKSGTVSMQPPPQLRQRQMRQGQNEIQENPALSSTFLSQAGIDPNHPEFIYTPRSMTRLYAKAGIAQIKRLLKAGFRPLGDAHGVPVNPKEEDVNDGFNEADDGKGNDEEGDIEGGGDKEGDGEEGGDEEGGGEEDGGGSNDGSNDESNSDEDISSDESDSDESEISSVDIDAELGLATDGTAAKLAAEAAAKKKAKETWTELERSTFEFALTDLAEYDEERRWIKIQKRVKTRTLKECKKFMKVLIAEEKKRNREVKSFMKDLKEKVVLNQSISDQIFDVFVETVEKVEIVDFCRLIFVSCANKAVETAPSVVRLENERGRVRREEEMLRKTPWLSLKTKTKQMIPRVLARAIRSMLRNGSLTKSRAHKLVELYRRAPTLEEEDDDIDPKNVENLTTRSVTSMVGEAITLAETDEPFADLELEETEQGITDTHGRIASKLSLRRHEAMLQREKMHREREFTLLSSRQQYVFNHLHKEKNRVNMVESHLETRTYIRDQAQKIADDWELVITGEEMRMNADVTLKRTWCVPKELNWSPPLKQVITKERLILGEDGTPEKGPDGVTPTGRKESYEEEIDIDEKQSLLIESKKIEDKINNVKNPVMITNEEGEEVQAMDENGELKFENVHSKPISITFNKWEKHEYDRSGPIPKWSFHIEMNDEVAMNDITYLFSKKVEEGDDSERKDEEIKEREEECLLKLTSRPLYDRYNDRQIMRKRKLEKLCDVVRRENVKVHMINISLREAMKRKEIRNNHYIDIKDELKMFHRRCSAVNRMENVHNQLLTWIAHRASRSMQTKDELLLLAKNAQHKVRKAQTDLDNSENPLTRAFCEQRLNEKLLEADKVLRYVRKRFHAELNVRRKLASERRDALLQQCARLNLISKLSLERMRLLRNVRRSQENELIHVSKSSDIILLKEEEYHGNGASVDATVSTIVNDLISNVIKTDMINSGKYEIETVINKIHTNNTNIKNRDMYNQNLLLLKQQYEKEKEITLSRATTREREHSTILDEIEKLEGVAGEWLSNNQVQQAEDQLALARSVLDDQKKMMELFKEEARIDVEELKEKMIIQEITSKANEKMLQNEITSRRRAAGLAIAHMQKVAEQARDALEHLRKEKDAEIMRMAESHAKQMAELNARLEELELLADRRGKWVNSLQVQIKLMRKEMVEFQRKYKEEHEQWERERNGLIKQLKYETTQSERRLAWIESLKVEVDVKKKEQIKLKEDTLVQINESKEREKELKWNVWQRDETARRIRMDVDSVFKWFLESVANLAGASKRHNDRIHYNGGVGVLNAVISKECLRPDIKPLAARAIGALAWNGFVDHRVISRRARDSWSAWIGVVAAEEKWRFDLGEENMRATIAAEANALRASQEEKATTAAMANRTVRLLKEAYVNNDLLRKNHLKNALVDTDGVLGPEYKVVSGGPLTDYTHGAPDDNRVQVLSQQEAMKDIGPSKYFCFFSFYLVVNY
jgi:hypothetical protein